MMQRQSSQKSCVGDSMGTGTFEKAWTPRRQVWGREEKPLFRKCSLSPMPLCPFKALPPTFPENRLRPTIQKAKRISTSTLSAPPSANALRPHAKTSYAVRSRPARRSPVHRDHGVVRLSQRQGHPRTGTRRPSKNDRPKRRRCHPHLFYRHHRERRDARRLRSHPPAAQESRFRGRDGFGAAAYAPVHPAPVGYAQPQPSQQERPDNPQLHHGHARHHPECPHRFLQY